MSTSERLRQLRKDLGMSQEEFGRRIGVSNTAISKLEKNERNLTEQTAKSICREFRVIISGLPKEKVTCSLALLKVWLMRLLKIIIWMILIRKLLKSIWNFQLIKDRY